MFQLYANKNILLVRQKEPLTSGSVNVYRVGLAFSADWEGLAKTAVFRAGDKTVSVIPDGAGECVVPWEVLQTPGDTLSIGVYGTLGGEVVLPTIWATLGSILEGASPGDDAQPPTPDLWQQALDAKQDKLTGQPGQVVGFDEAGNAVPQENVGGTGTADHNKLSNRDMANQHPIEAITGLEETLETIPAPLRRITNTELEEMLT